ncbi:hypothetical protein [Burkholderia stagnalis]|uniref:Gp65 n=1 Tax=Burkholderia stagnalis TaxID=1503054 RepID=A0ABX9YUM8_9BURK|nr:hypothetical protein [Burkholderia stagnalis]MBR7961227.1 hypothetical protein [Burkholderia vietnamiensis]RQQ64379.1 hypothetical protein DF158_06125 [Burkholderia stagnalis]RQQ99996.1 hypothetical protein DF025_36675 [Burkholderia stagnalis]RQR15258.1 hypothetical protein DF021_06125 [Burkholderia stagnalis]RQR25150.1 hypothetical protein DF026_00010 [Burkholderia stagnalis]
MSEVACIELSSVPEPLKAIAASRIDEVSGERIVSFPECPVVGREVDNGEIEFSFPRGVALRESLIDWMLYWGIPFRVMP